jgi:SAM-dependent methyltransferase
MNSEPRALAPPVPARSTFVDPDNYSEDAGSSLRKLNLGCGTDIKYGWVNLDKAALPGVDIVHDLETLPLPFPDGSFDHVCAKDVLEHVDYVPLLKELHRVLSAGGILEIQVPHFTSVDNYIDPTHRRQFSIRTFDFFVQTHSQRAYYFDFSFSTIRMRRLTFVRAPLIYNYLIEPLVNAHARIQKYYELTCMSRIFPAENIRLVLVK